MCYAYGMTNTTEEHVTIEICVDCLMLHANGDTSGIDDPEREAEVLAQARIKEGQYITLGTFPEEHYEDCPNVDHETETFLDWECECDQVTFSMNSCEACGSRLGGARERATLWFTP